MLLLHPPAGSQPPPMEMSDEDLERLYIPGAGRHVRGGFVSGLDGAVEVDGRSAGLGGGDDHRVFFTLRAVCDVILVGSGTLLADDYGPAKLSGARQERRAARHQGLLPPIAVLNASASLDPGIRLFASSQDGPGASPRPIVLCAASAPAERRAALGRVAEVVECGDQRVDLPQALDALAERGLSWVLCEGGPTLASALIAQRLLDELCLSQAMALPGPGRKTLSQGVAYSGVVPLRLGHLLLGDGVLVGRWELDR